MNDVWLAVFVGVVTALGGGTGIATLIRVRHDKRLGIAQQEVSTDDAIAKRFMDLADAQMRTLVQPLEVRIATAEQRIRDLEGQVKEKDEQIDLTRTAYWRAISYIRTLVALIRANLPESTIPQPHSDLAADI